jgi:2-aminoadipate transaminase
MERIDLSCGSLGEVPLLEEVIQEALKSVDVSSLGYYSDPQGLLELREQVAELYDTTADNVLITSSGQQAVHLAFDYVDKDNVLIQQPSYFGAIRLLKDTHTKILGDQVTPEDVVYLTSNFHSVTSKSISEQEKDFLAESGATVIEDNPYDFLHYDQKPTPILERNFDNTIHVGSFSKILAPGLRVGYVIAEREVIEKLRKIKINHDLFTPTLNQQVCSYALKQDYLDELREQFKQKRDSAHQILTKYFSGTDITWEKPEGGLFFLLQGNEVSMEKVVGIAKDKYSLVLGKDKFSYLDGKSRNAVRINFVSTPSSVFAEAVDRLYNTYQEVKNEL